MERCGIASNVVRIVHMRDDYPETIIFWCGAARVLRVLDAATGAGFPARPPSSPPRRGIPFRWVAIAQVVVVWNVLAFLDQGLHPWSVPRPRLLMIAALGLLLGVAFAIQISEAAQAWALKPGRSVSEVVPFLRLVQLIGGFLFAGLTLQMLF